MNRSCRVTLLRPPLLCAGYRSQAKPPLGLAYVAGALRAAGHDVTCIDAPGEALEVYRKSAYDTELLENGLSFGEIFSRVPASSEVIGIPCMFSYEWFFILEFIRELRARFPSQLIILGGEHASADHDYILKTMPEVDACVLGEGEAKIVGLVDAFSRGVPKRDLPGVAVLDPETRMVRRNPESNGRYRIENINSIARPAWDLFPLAAYLDLGVGYGSVLLRAIPMLASRGCPYRCTFCSSPEMWTTRWKARDIDDLIDEIRVYRRDYGIDHVEFYDLSVLIDKEWIVEFCQKLIEADLKITWTVPSGTRTEGLTPQVLALIKRSGGRRLTYPLETGNPRVSALIKKKINYRLSLGSMRNAIKAGFPVKTHIIIGFPFQSWSDILIEYAFAIRLAWIGAHDVLFFTFAPYPGSELHQQLVAEGRIVKDENYPKFLRKLFITSSNIDDSMSFGPHLSGRGLWRACMLGMALFYCFQFLFRPHRLFLLLHHVYLREPVTGLEGLVFHGVRAFRRRSRVLPAERSQKNRCGRHFLPG